MDLPTFHPAVARWFAQRFPAPTGSQSQAWSAIQAGRHTLVAAPTGSGKTLAAFLAAIDELVRLGIAGGLADEIRVVYVSPLKALSNDIQRNLEQPLAGIRAELAAAGLPELEIRTLVRTGDTPQSERAAMRRRPPHILVTTPETLYILLTSESGRAMLGSVRTVIVDEIHALAPNKRGAHLALSLERLEALTGPGLRRIGLSATQRPVEEVARFLVGAAHCAPDGTPDCALVDTGHVRARDLALEVPPSPLEAVMSAEVWEQVYDRIAELVAAHRTTLVFVNTRRLCERVARHLAERLGEDAVTSHHGSLAREHRLAAEQKLKAGALRALVATASLELGIDIGDVDLVCQLGSPRSIAALLQRVGRSGHAVTGTPRGRLFPLSRDELVECAALLDAVRRGELDRLSIPERPLDVLAQQIVAEVACREWAEDELYDRIVRAWPYRKLARADFDAVVRMLADGFATSRGRRAALLHRDAVHRRLRARRGARLTAITSGGTIPDLADYQVILEPGGRFIGTLNEDFAIESLAGDIFQLGNHSYRIQRVEAGTVRVEDAHGQPPNLPFWIGEAPGRSDELSGAVARLRRELAARLEQGGVAAAQEHLIRAPGLEPAAAAQIAEYLAAARAALGALPTHDTVILERFFDESGGMQLVVHAPFGSRINRAWGLALRKRFCRKFNFELQAAATEDAIVLSLTAAHSFPLEEVSRYLHPGSARGVLTQALLAAPLFTSRWRWNAAVALALPRFQGGRRTPPQLQRMRAEDLLGAVFPDQVACAENVVGDREIPDHPLVEQTLRDCLEEAMDAAGLERVLAAVHAGAIRIVARDLAEPSPLAQEILSARPYAFLDDAPLEERRTQAVLSRRWLDPESAADLGRLDPEAIARVRAEAWPVADNPDELHDALVLLGFLSADELAAGTGWTAHLAALVAQRRATALAAVAGGNGLWVAAERLPQLQAILPDAVPDPEITAPAEFAERPWSREEALAEVVRGRLEGLGPVNAVVLAHALGVPAADVEIALAALESEGYALRGAFTEGALGIEWCERGLLARIQRYTLKRLRREIEPVSGADFLRFLFVWQRVALETRGEGLQALAAVLEQLDGFEAPAAAWEADLLPARLSDYAPDWLDGLCRAGRVRWARLTPPRGAAPRERAAGPVRTTPIALVGRRGYADWRGADPVSSGAPHSARARAVADYLCAHGASFFDELLDRTGLLRTQLEEALGELVAAGRVTADGFDGLRALLVPSNRRRAHGGGAHRHHRPAPFAIEDAGRWALLPGHAATEEPAANPAADHAPGERRPRPWSTSGMSPERVERIARTLLRRYGVVFRRVLERETAHLPTWRELLLVYRRLEARGEIRGGRFVATATGEQYALPEAVGTLRDIRRREKTGTLISVSAADPLNLVGIVTPGVRVPALAANRILYRDGVPVAVHAGREVRFLEPIDPHAEWDARNALLRRAIPPGLRGYLGSA